MLSSNRKFGVEIEFDVSSEVQLHHLQKKLRIEFDGSLRGLNNPGEWVSDILQGESGINTLVTACSVLKKHGANCDNPKTSMHIHLDGMVGEGVLKSSKTAPNTTNNVIAISKKLRSELSSGAAMILIQNRQRYNDGNMVTTEIDGIIYYSKAALVRKPRMNYVYYYLDKPDRFKWLQNSFYFYTLFSDVMENIVSNSRRFGNMYCIPLGSSYSLDAIEACKDMKELKNLWYKGAMPSRDYDNSRYQNVNLHSFWYKHGTLEIRSHGGTIDPVKILMWLRLHQTIVDKMEDTTVEELKKMTGTPEEFINFLGDDMLGDYVKRLLGYYSNVKIK